MKTVIAAVVILVALPALSAEVLPFVENDFAKAVSQANLKKQPIFVEAWAPW